MGFPPTLLFFHLISRLCIVPSLSLEPFLPLPHLSSSATASSATSSSTKSGPPSSLSTTRSPTISSNHVPLSPLSIDNISSDTPGTHHQRRRRRHDLDEPQPVFASLVVFSLMPHHHPLPPHMSHPTNGCHQLHKNFQIQILVYPPHLLRLV
jgi:hypothetical protein